MRTETNELLIVRRLVSQERDLLVKEMNEIFNESTIREAEKIRNMHDCTPLEDLLRPFNL